MIEPLYSESDAARLLGVNIICADARDVIGSIAADAIITDPVWPNCPPGLLAGSERPMDLLRETLNSASDSIKRVVVVLRSDSDPRFLDAVPKRWPFICLQALPYAVPMYHGRVLGGTECAYAFGTPIKSREGRRLIPMWAPKAQPTDRPANGHPCSRSLSHMRWLVNWWSEPDETVLDPFCGSGTIPVAAMHLGRKAIGIEIDMRFAALARARIAETDPLFRVAEVTPRALRSERTAGR